MVLLGNKCDLVTTRVCVCRRQQPFPAPQPSPLLRVRWCNRWRRVCCGVQAVSTIEGEALARKLGVLFYETSALTSDHVEEVCVGPRFLVLPLYPPTCAVVHASAGAHVCTAARRSWRWLDGAMPSSLTAARSRSRRRAR